MLYSLAVLLISLYMSVVKVIVGRLPSSRMSVQEVSMMKGLLSSIRWTWVVWESLDDPHRLPVQVAVGRWRWRTRDELWEFDFIHVQWLYFFECFGLGSWFSSFPRVRDWERGSVEDPKLTIERFNHAAADDCDELTVQVSIAPAETDQDKEN